MAEVLQVLQVLSALLLMLADAVAMLLLELELAAALLGLLMLLHALLYQLACSAWASALQRHPLRRQEKDGWCYVCDTCPQT